ncbi:IS630 family transposase (plasmid) [Acaryochloris sp. CCMEE 5410]|nr:IS630 family transposase [Acaryochloris sp. CCMEE 5410]
MSDINRKVISEYLFLGLDTINKYIKIYKTDGIEKLFDFSYSNIKKSDNKKYIDKVFEIIHSPPAIHGINRTSWRQSDVYQIMKKKGFKVSKDNIRKIIKNAGYSYRNAKKVLTSSDPAYKEKLKAIQDILSNLRSNEKFFSIDEFGPFSVKIYGGKVLTPPGQLRTVPQWQKSKGSLIATAALELSTNQVSHFYSEKKNTKEMIRLIGLLLEEYKNENCIYISWDAASWHASQELYKYVEEVNKKDYRNTNKTPIVKLAPLPSGAQFLNVIESVFSGMSKAILHNSNYESIEHCKKAIDRYFDERNQHFKENPKRAGKKIWGNEIVKPVFSESNNCKDPRWR